MTMLIDVLAADLRQTLRDFRRSPGLTLAIVATLALGVGMNAAMFTVLDRILFRQPDGVRTAETSATDPVVLLTTAIVLGVVASVAGLVPAMRATAVNPVIALQAD